MKILIKNGTIVNADKTFKSDVVIKDGIISEISDQITPKKEYEIIDASDKYVFPGGIDPHVHLNLPTPAGYSSDNFFSGSKAALYGGTTTFIDFVTPHKGQSLVEALNERKKEAEASIIDYSFHVSPVDWHENIENEIQAVIQEGVTSFKVYMAYKNSIGLNDDVLLKVMKAVRKAGGMITVHAEMGDEIDELRDSFAKQGKLSPEYHALSRPNRTEADAVSKIIEFSEQTECPVYIVHVSAKETIDHIKIAQKKGLKILAETCPQYLLLDDSKLKGTFEETAKYVFSPVLRKKEDNNAIWQGIADTSIQTIGTDHCPFSLKQKKIGEADFRKIPNGAGGVEHRLSLMYTYGVLEEKISINDFVALTSTNAAKIFGLFPKKGTISIGSDADIVIWDSKVNRMISNKTHHQNGDLNIFENTIIKGEPKLILSKGKVVFKNNQLSLQLTQGQFLKRKL